MTLAQRIAAYATAQANRETRREQRIADRIEQRAMLARLARDTSAAESFDDGPIPLWSYRIGRTDPWGRPILTGDHSAYDCNDRRCERHPNSLYGRS